MALVWRITECVKKKKKTQSFSIYLQLIANIVIPDWDGSDMEEIHTVNKFGKEENRCNNSIMSFEVSRGPAGSPIPQYT